MNNTHSDIYNKRIFWLDYHYYDVNMILFNRSYALVANSKQEAEEKLKQLEQPYVVTITKSVYYWFNYFV